MSHNKMHFVVMGIGLLAILVVSRFIGGALLPLGFLVICFGMMAFMMLMMSHGGDDNSHNKGDGHDK